MDENTDPPNGEEPEETTSPEPTTKDTFADKIFDLIGHDDIYQILAIQDDALETLLQTTENVSRINEFATKEYNTLMKDYAKHTKMLKEMKQDLDYIFQKIRATKTKINATWPECAHVQHNSL